MGAPACRACGSTSQFEVLDLGNMPLAGDFRLAGERNELYPLAIAGCRACGILQVREMVDPKTVFTANYSFASSTVPGLVRHFGAYALEMAPEPRARRPRLLEVGCNDGVFLEPLSRVGYDVVGVDASANVGTLARGKGFPVYTDFFGINSAKQIVADHGRFDVVTCSNVFAHNPDVNGFLEGVRAVLREDGVFWVEVHDAASLLAGLQWDCFYHEHCFYWTIQALQRRLADHGFSLVRWSRTDMHGGGLRAVFGRGTSVRTVADEPSESEWKNFQDACRRSRTLLHDTISTLPIHYAYGAAGRAVTLLNWSGIADRFEYVVDGSPLRYGRVIPNTCTPIISEAEYSNRATNDWCFVTAHNYLDDIRRKVEAASGGRNIKFVTPLPYVSVR